LSQRATVASLDNGVEREITTKHLWMKVTELATPVMPEFKQRLYRKEQRIPSKKSSKLASRPCARTFLIDIEFLVADAQINKLKSSKTESRPYANAFLIEAEFLVHFAHLLKLKSSKAESGPCAKRIVIEPSGREVKTVRSHVCHDRSLFFSRTKQSTAQNIHLHPRLYGHVHAYMQA
jgi:hypothetical protein